MAEDLVFRIKGEDDSQPAFKSVKKSMEDLGNTAGVSAKQTAAAMRMVPAQLTDIITSLQGGQAPLTVLIQQGGQLKDMFGGVAPAAKALGGYIFEMVNPLTLAAAGAAGLFLAFEQGRSEAAEYNKQLALTGGYAGLSASQLAILAAAMSKTTGTQHEAADVLAAMVATGKIAGDQFGVIGDAVLAMSRSTGAAVKDIVADFVALGDEPVKASEKLNESHHYLTEAVWEQIKALEEEGKRTEAAALAQTTYANAVQKSAETIRSNLGFLQTSWNGVADAAKWAWDKMMGIGRDKTGAEELAKLQKDLAIRESRDPKMMGDGWEQGNEKLRARIALMTRINDGAASNAKRQAEQAKDEQASIASAASVSAIQDKAKGAAAINRELEKYRANIEAIKKVNPNSEFVTPQAVASGEAVIRKQYAAKAAAKPSEVGLNTGLEVLKGQTQGVERDLKASLAAINAAYDQGVISARQSLQQQFEARQTALAQELTIAKKQEELAGGKRNLAEAERYKNERKRIEGEMTANMVGFQSAVTTLAAKTKRAVDEYQTTLNAAYNTRQQSIDDQLQGAGMGPQALQELQRMTELRREVDRRREELVRDRGRNQIGQEQFDQELAALDGYWTSRVTQEETFNAKSKALRMDWSVGAKSAVATYLESAQDIAGQTNRLWSNAFNGMEDALVNFAKTGKLSFSSLADSIISDMIRMQVRASMAQSLGGGGLLSAVTSLFGGSSAGGAAASLPSSIYSLATGGSGLGLKPNAKGGVYESPSLHAYVNTVVDKPTTFAFAKGVGLMGEAGNEAIMPLKRGPDGSLGVAADLSLPAAAETQLVVNLSVEQYGGTQQKVETEQRQNPDGSFDVKVLLRDMTSALADDVNSGSGPLYSSMRSRFGLNDSMG